MTPERTQHPKEPSRLADLAHHLLCHLQVEEETLREAWGVLAHLHQGLRRANLGQLRAIQEDHADLANQLEQIRRVRGELIRSIGQAMNVPAEKVTVRGLVEQLPQPLASDLENARARTAKLAQQVESLNRQNGVLAMHCLSFVQGYLSDLYGEASSARYSRAGQPSNPGTALAPIGSLLEVRG